MLLLGCCSAASAGDWHVDPLFGSDTAGDGSAGAPWLTVCHAVSTVHGASLDPACIHLADGLYSPITNGEPPIISLENWQYLEGSSPERTVVHSSLFIPPDCRVSRLQANLYCHTTGTPVIDHCLFTNYTSCHTSGDGVEPLVINCTFVDSIAAIGHGDGAKPLIVNCLFLHNPIGETDTEASRLNAFYCRTETLGLRDGCYRFEPALVDPRAGDFRLRYDSPCRGAGHPLPDPAWGVPPLADLGALPYEQIPYLHLRSFRIDDPPPFGDGDGEADAGETFSLVPVLENGGEDCASGRAYLYSYDQLAEVLEDERLYGEIPRGAWKEPLDDGRRMRLRLDPGLARGHAIHLGLRLLGEPGENHLVLLTLTAGGTGFHVDAVHGSDSLGDGTAGRPWATITYAAEHLEGDPWSQLTINAAPGLYSPDSGEGVPVNLGPFETLQGAENRLTWLLGDNPDQDQDPLILLYAHSSVRLIGFYGGYDGVRSPRLPNTGASISDCWGGEDYNGTLAVLQGTQTRISGCDTGFGTLGSADELLNNTGNVRPSGWYVTGNLATGEVTSSGMRGGTACPGVFAGNTVDLTSVDGGYSLSGSGVVVNNAFLGCAEGMINHVRASGLNEIYSDNVFDRMGLDVGHIYPSHSSYIVHHNFFDNHGMEGTALISYDTDLQSVRNIFFNSDVAIACHNTLPPAIRFFVTYTNDVFYGNELAMSIDRQPVDVTNCIIWNNARDFMVFGYPSLLYVYYSDFQDSWEYGDHNINADPLFANPLAGDFSLLPGSPCIDVGDPWWGYNDQDGTRNDMGALGGPRLDEEPPWIERVSPAAGATGVPQGATVTIELIDDILQIKRETLRLWINGAEVEPRLFPLASGLALLYQPQEPWPAGSEVTARVFAEDWATPANQLDAEATRFRVREAEAHLSVSLYMPVHHYEAGGNAALDLLVENRSDAAARSARTCVALDLGLGTSWFWPSWRAFPDQLDWECRDYPPGVTSIQVLPPFAWPELNEPLTEGSFVAAVIGEDDALISNLSRWTFTAEGSGR